jgi:hypothetical protein
MNDKNKNKNVDSNVGSKITSLNICKQRKATT